MRRPPGSSPTPLRATLAAGRAVPRGVWLLCLLGALGSLLLSATLFRNGSVNNDEGVYLQQAQLLRHGELTLRPVPGQLDASQPWLFAVRDGAFVGKYLPLVPALYAVGLLVAGSAVPVLAVMAGVLPLLVWRLGVRCGLSRRRAVLAAAVVTCSPLVLAQSALVLSYLPFLLLLLLGWEMALAHRDGPDRLRSVALGVVSAAAVCARPFDAVVLLGPVLAWAVVSARDAPVRSAGWFGIGAAPLAAATLAYNAAVTGSALRLPFGLFESADALGFGPRKLFPEDLVHDFGLREALTGLFRHFVLDGAAWTLVPAALLCIAFASRSSRRSAWRGGAGAISAACGCFVLGYLAFWGPYNASVLWGGTAAVGPFYALPLLPAAAILACGLPVPRAGPRRAALAVAVAVNAALNVGQAAVAASSAAEASDRTATLLRLAAGARERGRLLVDVDPPYLGHPVSLLRNGSGDRGQPVLLAGVLDPSSLPDVVGRAELLQLPGNPYAGDAFAYSLRKVVPVVAAVPVLEVRRVGAVAEVLVVERLGRRWACPVPDGPLRIRIEPDGVAGCAGAPIPPGWGGQPYRGCADAACLALSFHRLLPDGRASLTSWRRLVLARQGSQWLVPADGRVVEQRGRGWVEVTAAGSRP